MEAALALLQIDQGQGKDALKAIRGLFQDDKLAPLAILVIPRLGDLRPQKKEVVAGLLELAREKHPLAPIAAWVALDNIGPGADDCIGVLQEALKDPHPGIRTRSAIGLVRIDRKQSAEVEPVLLKVLDDEKVDSGTRRRAAVALLAGGAKYRQRVSKVLTSALNDPSVAGRLETAELLLRLAPEQADLSLAAMIGILKEKEREHRLRAVDLLTRMSLPISAADVALEQLFKDADAEVATNAVGGVIRLRPELARDLFRILLRNRDRRGQGAGNLFKLIEELHKLDADSSLRERIKTLTEQTATSSQGSVCGSDAPGRGHPTGGPGGEGRGRHRRPGPGPG